MKEGPDMESKRRFQIDGCLIEDHFCLTHGYPIPSRGKCPVFSGTIRAWQFQWFQRSFRAARDLKSVKKGGD